MYISLSSCLHNTPLHKPRNEPLNSNYQFALDNLSLSAKCRDLSSGSCFHGAILKSGFDADTIVSNALLNMYSKCGCLESTVKLFDEMPERTVVTWTSMMSAYREHGDTEKAISMFRNMLQEVGVNEFSLSVALKASGGKADDRLVEAMHCYVVKNEEFVLDSFLRNSLVDAYAKCGNLSAVEKLIAESDCKDVVSWTSAISGAVLNGCARDAMRYFFRMLEEGVMPNEITVLSILRACSMIDEPQLLKCIYGMTVKGGWGRNDLVMNSLMEMYFVNGHFSEGMRVFSGSFISRQSSYIREEALASILKYCATYDLLELGEQIHCYLIKRKIIPSLVAENSLINMYAENECGDCAFRIFTRMTVKDIVSWNTMITYLVKNESYDKALFLFRKIHRNRHEGQSCPDFVTVLELLKICINIGLDHLDGIIHGYITKTGLVCDTFVQNSLIDMYGKTGKVDSAYDIFENMQRKDIGSWNSIIAAFGMNGNGTHAVHMFKELNKAGTEKPNEVTFVNILSACGHAGIIERGLEIFRDMESKYGVKPSVEHFACVVDMLGRSGRIDEAERFIEIMPIKPTEAIWGSLLGASGIYGRIDVAERATKQLLIMDPESTVWRISMSNVYAAAGRWDDAAKLRAEVKKLNGKEVAWSSVEVRGDNFIFMVNDTGHPESKRIYEVLSTIMGQISDYSRKYEYVL